MTMCPMFTICIIVKESPKALTTLQCGVNWHYDIMSDSQMWITRIQM